MNALDVLLVESESTPIRTGWKININLTEDSFPGTPLLLTTGELFLYLAHQMIKLNSYFPLDS